MKNYTKLRPLGKGGFGEVWLAHHTGLNCEHAVKVVKGAIIGTPSVFFKEPRLLKSLEHPNIVKVHDAWEENNELYIAMEHLPDGSLDAFCGGNPIKLRRLKHIFCEALRGLQFVHDRAYIHRDIKPGNILISPQGHGKVADFGLAIPSAAAISTFPAGTSIYFAPEVFITGEMSVLTDIYAMGVALYQCVNGDSFLPAVAGGAALRDAVIKGDFPDRHYYRAYIPRSLKTIINKAMNIDPAKRFQTADELREALEQTKIRCSWTESRSFPFSEWTTESNQREIKVQLSHNSGSWELFVLQRVKPSRKFRHVKALEAVFSSESAALAQVSAITSALVSGKSLSDI